MYYENCASLASLLHHILICLEATSRGTARAPTGEGARAARETISRRQLGKGVLSPLYGAGGQLPSRPTGPKGRLCCGPSLTGLAENKKENKMGDKKLRGRGC